MGKVFVITPIAQKKEKILSKICMIKILLIEYSIALTYFCFAQLRNLMLYATVHKC